MHNTLKLAALGLTASLTLAACGGGGTGGVTPPEPTPNAGVITRPTDSTANNEFVITGERARAAAQSLGLSTQSLTAQNLLQPQATQDELRILLSVTRAKTGDNAGKKRATATFVWGNGTEQIVTPADVDAVTLDIYPQSNPANVRTYKSGLGLKVEYPDFQDKVTRNGSYVSDQGAMCARLVFNLTTKPNTASTSPYTPLLFNNASSPLEVCEGVAEQNADKVALEKAADGLMYDRDSLGAASFTFVRKSGAGLPTGLELIASENLSGATINGYKTLADFFGPLTVLPAGDSKTWTAEQKAAAAKAKKYQNLQKQFGYYYSSAQVYEIKQGSLTHWYILGLNGWGVGGLKTLQFVSSSGTGGGGGTPTPTPTPAPTIGYLQYQTADSFATASIQASSVSNATSATYTTRTDTTCGAASNGTASAAIPLTKSGSLFSATQTSPTPGSRVTVTATGDGGTTSASACIVVDTGGISE